MSEAGPHTLGRYRLLSLLGEGGMGKVYRGFDSTLKRNVAIKLLPPERVADPSRLSRFMQEARAASALNHPNVITVYDIGEEHLEGDHEQVRYIAMELVEGKTLRELVRGEHLDVRQALKIAIQAAEGLVAAHAAGIIHRDLKPENIMINRSDVVKVLDFGLAKLRPGEEASDPGDSRTMTPATEPGFVMGTPGYMSPEQARGHLLDARSDIFSLGSVLYEIAVGRPAFESSSSVETMHKVIHSEPVAIGEIRPDLPIELGRIIRKTLAKDPDERYQSAKEVLIDLRNLLHELDTSPGTVPGHAAAAPRPRQKRAIAYAAILAGILGVVALAFAMAQRPRGHGTESATESLQIRRVTATGKVIQAAIAPDAKLTAYVISHQGEQTLVIREMSTGQTLTLIPARRSSYWGMTFAPDSSSIYFGIKDNVDPAGAIYRISALGGTPRKIVDAVDSQVTFSPDGKQLAFLRAGFPSQEESAVLIANVDGSNVRMLAKVHAPEFFVPIFFAGPSWSPDGTMIATAVVSRVGKGRARGTAYFTPEVQRTSRIVGIDIIDGSMKTIADHHWAIVAQVAWMPDQKGLVAIAVGASARSFQVWYVPYPTGDPRPVTHDLFDYRIVSLSADGKSLVTVASEINADVWIVREGVNARRITALKAEGIYGTAAMPDGRVVATSIETGKLDLFVMNADGSGRQQITHDEHSNRSPAVTPDGKQLVYLSVTPKGPEVCRIDIDGSDRMVLAKTSSATAALDVSPDGNSVVYEDLIQGRGGGWAQFVGVFRVSIEGGPGRRVGTDNLAVPVFSPDGSKIAGLVSDESGREYLAWMPASGGPATRISPWPTSADSMTRWTPDGTALVVNTVEGDRANLWLIPLDGSPRRKLTNFDEHILFTFAPLAGENGWVLSRGDISRDAVLITGFRPAE
ncbi:MAG TPA: protein kinase [Thermoanaerobaculia bacterium]